MDIGTSPGFKVLVVDLDGTLIKGDLLKEAACDLMTTRPWNVWGLFMKTIQGPLALKNYLAGQVHLDPNSLVFRPSVLNLIQNAKSKDIRVVLASASPDAWVKTVAHHLGVFDHSVGSTTTNLKGEQKLAAIRALTKDPFAYVGNSSADHPIWEAANTAFAVNPSSGSRARFIGKTGRWIEIQDGSTLKSWFQSLRTYQWAKNLLLFIPMIAAHQTIAETEIKNGLLAFCAFCVTASSVYLMNDFADRKSDRRHASKKKRPLASGDLPLDLAVVTCLGLAGLGFVLSLLVSQVFAGLILLYFVLNLAYSFFLKSVPMLDVLILSGMYTLRIIAGGKATTTVVSQWLLVFSTFFFMGLALVKRYTETLTLAPKQGETNEFGRGYTLQDAHVLLPLGMGSSLLSILVFALYLHSPAVLELYKSPDRLWSLVPLMLYWVGRLWLLAGRREMHDDPVAFALKDRVSWIVGLIGLLLLKWSIDS